MMADGLSLQSLIGKGYNRFWHCKKRYRVVKGSRGSKKSTTAAINIIVRMMSHPAANTLVVRQTLATIKDSCYAQLRWAIHQLGADDWWIARSSPLELEYKPTGQRIIFRGLDDELKVTSITVATGVLCWAWIEEAYEISEKSFDIIDESIRGIMPEGLFPQITLTFNPWDASSWLKAKFFDPPPKGAEALREETTFALSTDYRINEWLSAADLRKFDLMRLTDPKRYKVAGLGEWGISEGQYFDVWDESKHIVKPFPIPKGWIKYRTMDWGSYHPYAVLWLAIDYDGNMWVYRELYGWGGKPNVGTKETAKQVAERIAEVERPNEVYYAVLDNACWASTGVTGPTIAEELNETLYDKGLTTFDKCSKGRIEGANAIRDRLIGNISDDGETKPALYFFSSCVHSIRTIPMIGHDKSNPETYDTKGEDHIIDALAYGCMARPWTPQEEEKPTRYDGYRHEVKIDNGWLT